MPSPGLEEKGRIKVPEISIQVTRGDQQVRFNCQGKASLEGYRSIADTIRWEMAEASWTRRALVDIKYRRQSGRLHPDRKRGIGAARMA